MRGLLMTGSTKRQRGAALAELAVALPILTLVMLGVVDFARVWVQSSAVENAAHAGAQYGAQTTSHAEDTAGIYATVMADLNDSAVDEETYTVVSEKHCECDGATLDCDDPCTTDTKRTYVRVRVGSEFRTLFDYPGIPSPLNVSREVQVRAR
jgi:Flp pilus assembly protein TadG